MLATVAVPSTTYDLINSPGDVDTFDFDAVAGQQYSLYTTLSAANARLQLLDTDGTTSIDSTEFIGAGYSSHLTWLAPTSDTYFVSVRGGMPEIDGSYSLRVELPDPDHGDVNGPLTHLSVPATTSGDLDWNFDIDTFSFTAVAGKDYFFYAAGFHSDPSIPFNVLPGFRLYDADALTLLAFAPGLFDGVDPEIVSWRAPISGDYFVAVEYAFGLDGTYGLSIDVDDHGNTASSATALAVPSSTNADHEGPSDVDFFAFDAVAGTDYLFGSNEVYVAIYDTDGTTQLSAKQGSWTAPDDGTYFLRASGITGDYTLTLDLAMDSEGNSPDNATAISFPSTTVASIDYGVDRDVFAFPATAGTTYNFDFAVDTLHEASIWLIGPDGESELYSDFNFKSDQFSWVATDDGTHFFQVSAGRFASVGSYELTVEAPVDDHGDAPDSATLITVPATIAARKDFVGDSDFFGFDAVQGTVYSITTSQGVNVYDVDGEQLTSNTHSVGNWLAPQDGRYYLRASSSLAFVDYTLEISEVVYTDDFGNTLATASPISVPSITAGEFEVRADVDYVSFTPVPGVTYNFAASGSGMRLSLYEAGNPVALHSFPAIPGWTAPSAGPYFLGISTSSTTSSYLLDIQAVTDDHADDFTAATPIIIGTTTDATIFDSTDVDFFAFQANAGQVYDLFAMPLAFANIRLRLFDTDGVSLLADDLGSASGALVQWITPSTDLYYLEVLGRFDGDVGTYQVGVLETDYADDHGNLPSLATVVAVPSMTTGQIEVGVESDFFQFSATAATVYDFSLAPTAWSYAEILLYDASSSAPFWSHRDASSRQWLALESGDYFLEVRSYLPPIAGSYTLNVDAVTYVDDYGNLESSATPITIPSQTAGAIEVGPDRDNFSFSGTSGQLYEMRLDANSVSQSLIEVRRSDGRQVVTTPIAGGQRWIADDTDTYFVSVQSSSLDTGAYSLVASAISYSDDFGNRPGTAQAVAVPSSTSGAIETNGDTDVFLFSAVAGTKYNLLTTTSVELKLLGADGATELATSDSRVNAGGAMISWTAPVDGDYFVSVRDFMDVAPRNYTLNIADPEDDHGDGTTGATPILLPDAEFAEIRFEGEFETLGDSDYFAFEFETGIAYAIEVDRDSLRELDVRLIAPDGVTELISHLNMYSELDWLAAESGTYFLKVSDFGGDELGQYFASIAFDDHGRDAGATPVVAPSTTFGELQFGNDSDQFVFSATAGTLYNVILRNISDSNHRVALYDVATGGESFVAFDYAYSSAGVAIVSHIPEEDGEYGISVVATSSFTDDFGVYSVELQVGLDDHSNDHDDATSIAVPSTTAAGIDLANDTDYFTFDAVAGTTYNLFTTAGSIVDTELSLYVDNRMPLFPNLLASNDDGGTGRSSLIHWTAPSDGPYLLAVQGGTDSIVLGDYTLSIEIPLLDANDSFDVAETLAVPSQTNRRIDVPGDRDFFAFAAVEGTQYNFIANTSSTLEQTDLWLYDTDGVTEIRFDDDSLGFGSSLITWTAPQDGTYFLEVADDLDANIGDYSVEIQIPGDDHGNVRSAATSIAVPGVEASRIDFQGDVDFFAFTATAGTLYNFIPTLDPSKSVAFSAYAADGLLVKNDAYVRTGAVVSWRPVDDGVVFVSIKDSTDSTIGNVAFEISVAGDDHGDVLEEATPVTIPAATGGRLDFENDLDFFSFDATVGKVYRITATASDPTVEFSLRLLPTSNPFSIPQYRNAFQWTPLGSLTYFLEVASYRDSMVADYTLEVVEVIYPDDHGSTADEATPIAISSVTPGELEIDLDADFFSFNAIAGEVYKVTAIPGSLTDATLSLYSSSRNLPTDIGSVVGGRSATVDANPIEDEVYHVKVSDGLGDFELMVEAVTYDDDHGNVSDTATMVGIPSTTSGEIEIVGDSDFFAFDTNVGTRYSFRTDSTSTMRVTIYGVDGTTALTNASGATSWIAPSSDRYYARVEYSLGFLRGYSFVIEPATDDHGASDVMATPMSLPSIIDATSNYGGDEDFYSFAATAGRVYDVSFQSDDLSYTGVRLLDQNGTTSLRSRSSDGDLRWVAPDSGIYFVSVSDSNEVGDYTLGVSEILYSDDHPNIALTATPVSAQSTTAGEIEVSGDVDRFSLVVTAGSVYAISSVPGTLANTVLAVIDKDGITQLAIHDDSVAANAAVLNWTPPSDGTYFVEVRADGGVDVGDYQLDVQVTTGYADDHGNTSATATTLVTPSITAGQIELSGDADFLAFTADAGLVYSITTNVDFGDAVTRRLFASDGVTLLATDPSQWLAPETGLYFLEIRDSGDNATVGYSVQLEAVDYQDDHANRASDATMVGISSVVVGDIEGFGDEDFFVFNVVEGETYEILIAGEYANRSTVALANPSGELIGTAALTRDPALRWTALSNGAASLRVYAPGGMGEYTLSIQAALPDDHANTVELATLISAPSTTTAVFEDGNDVDYFQFNATASMRYGIQLKSSVRSWLSLDAPNISGFANTEGFVVWTAPATGEYALSTKPLFYAEGNDNVYTIRIVELGIVATCDFIVNELGCDLADMNALYAGASGAPAPLTNALISQWLADASATSNLAKADLGDVYVLGDVDLSGDVDSTDLGLLLNSFGDTSGLGWGSGNLNADENVNSADLGLLLNNFGHVSVTAALSCDYVGGGNGCDIADINALYAGTDGAPTLLDDSLIIQWLDDASDVANPAKSNPNDVYVLGDTNLDGNVDSIDLGRLLNNFGDTSGLGWGDGNLNSDANVDSGDLGLLLNNFGFASLPNFAAGYSGVPSPVGLTSVTDYAFSEDEDEDEEVFARLGGWWER